MRCEQLLDIAYLYVDNQLTCERLVETNRHLEECRPCKRLVENEVRFRERTRGCFQEGYPGSDEGPLLFHRVMKDIRAKRLPLLTVPTVLVTATRITLAAAFSVAILLVGFFKIQEAKSIYARGLAFHKDPQKLEMETQDPAEMNKWLASKIRFEAELPSALASSPMKLAGASIVEVGDRDVAMLAFRMHGARVSYIWCAGDPKEVDRGELVEFEGEEFWVYTQGSTQFISWSDDGVNCLLITDCPREEALRCARDLYT